MKQLMLACGLLLGLSSCIKKVTIIVEQLPENTPEYASIFVTGNFNYWDPSDRSFLLKRQENGQMIIDLPYGWGLANFKFTRGDWKTVEKDACGHEIYDREADYFSDDTLRLKIESWSDLGPTRCEQVVLVINAPPETPKDACIFVASNHNDWDPGDSSSAVCRNENGEYLITVDKIEGVVEYKCTRGSWDSEELDENRQQIPNRQFVFGKQDTLVVNIAAWKDIVPGLEQRPITIVATTPPTTRYNDNIYICGTFNDWNPQDTSYMLTRIDKNRYAITFTKPAGPLEFKLTRGGWDTQEVDQYQRPIANRVFNTRSDTLKVRVQGWQDRNPRGSK